MQQNNVEDYLASKLRKASGKNADLWRELHDFYSKKLWHPLMNKVKQCVSDGNFTKTEDMSEIREKFIREFEHRVNPLTLTETILIMARLMTNKSKAIAFVESIKNTIKSHPEANALYLVGLAELMLNDRDASGRCPRIWEVKKFLDEAERLLNTLPGITTAHGPYYKVSANYYKDVGDYSIYYREALRYLGCVDVKSLSASDRAESAFCLCIAALLGEHVYNFGELLAHPVLDSLKGSQDYYLVDLLYAFNAGDIDKFENLRPRWSQQQDLKIRKTMLERKIRLLALMEMAFSRSSKDRRLNFNDISQTARIERNQVEHLAMKALALGLVKGHLDELDATFNVTWVQPRVLDKRQVSKMAVRFDHWTKDVKQVSGLVHEQAREILTQI